MKVMGDDDLTVFEHMTDLPRRRDALVRKVSRTLAATAACSLGRELHAEDWCSVVEAQAARMLLVRESAHAESERRRAAGELLARANEPGRTLPRDDR